MSRYDARHNRCSSPKQLAKNLAGQTWLLRDLPLELVTAGESDLLEQEQSFCALLVSDLKPEEFADMYAQTAAYGLFTARVFSHITMYGATVVAALSRTRELMQEIDAVANGQLWPEAAVSL